MDSEAIAEHLGVKPTVIELLQDIIPFPDIFEQFITANSQRHFWDLVDSLPRRFSLKLHGAELKSDTASRDFPRESLSPILQSFWASHRELLAIKENSQSKRPCSINSPAITQVTPDHVCSILSESEGWLRASESEWTFGAFVFSIDSLVNVCEAYISKGRPWFFCEIETVRSAYSACWAHAESIESRTLYLREKIKHKLLNFGYASSIQIAEDFREVGLDPAPDPGIPVELAQSLGNLVNQSKTIFRMPPRPLEIGLINDWIESRAEALVAQMNLPLQQRCAFLLTPAILQARMGQTSENPFEPFSLAELLFSDSNGEVAPMPFASARAELPATSPVVYCRSVLRRFVGRQLVGFGFQAASEPVMDILADVMGNEVKRIAQTAVAIQKGTGAASGDCLVHALDVCGYEASIFADGN
jgi:hypothetical protein